MNQPQGLAATTIATAPEQAVVPRLPLPEKEGWERIEGRLSGGYYRRQLVACRTEVDG